MQKLAGRSHGARRCLDPNPYTPRLHESQIIERSLAIDPNDAHSYALLADTYDTVWVNRLDNDSLNPAALEPALQLARRAVELDPNLPEGHAVLGFVFISNHQHDASVAEFERAIALNPNYADCRFS